MSSFIGQLRISLGLDSAAFETGAKRAAAEVNTLGTRAEKAGFKVGSMTKALVVGASAFAATAIVSQLKDAVSAGLDYAASLGETAQQLGVTTRTLQEYRYAADQVGISQDEMDNSLAKLTRTIGQAVEGGKKQSAAFEKLRISVRDANGNVRDAGDIIPELADALQKVGSPAERAAVLVDLFGKNGQKMGSLLADGAKGVNSLRQDAERLGIVMSDALIAKADAAADKMGSLNKIVTAKIAIAVAENADAILELADAFGALIDKASQAVNWVRKFAGAMEKADLGTTPFIKKLEKSGFFAPGAAKKYGAVYGLDENGNPLKTAGPAPSQTPSSGGALLRLPGGGGTFKPGQGPLAKFAGSGFALGNGIGDIPGMTPGRLDHGNYVRSVIDSLNGVTDATEESAKKTNASTVTIAKSFADMADDTVNALQNMSNSIRSGDFLSILGGAVKLFTQFGKIGLFGNAMATRLNTVPGFANGTNFAPGGLALVGERGPELVNLPRGSQVYPNGTGPGGGVQPYFDLRGAVVTQDLIDRMNAVGAVAAQVGGELGYRKVQRAGSRRLA